MKYLGSLCLLTLIPMLTWANIGQFNEETYSLYAERITRIVQSEDVKKMVSDAVTQNKGGSGKIEGVVLDKSQPVGTLTGGYPYLVITGSCHFHARPYQRKPLPGEAPGENWTVEIIDATTCTSQ